MIDGVASRHLAPNYVTEFRHKEKHTMKTRYITVTMTETEARKLLIMTGDSLYTAEDDPEIVRPAERAERKIRKALFELEINHTLPTQQG